MTSHHNARLTRFLATEADTLALGAALASGMRGGMVVYLSGDLGSGKTTLARGLLHALGVGGRIKSPTFTLVEPYTGSSLYWYHFDFYRFKRSSEWDESGFRDYFNQESLCIVEWPEKAGDRLPAPDVTIQMGVEDSGRAVTLDASSEEGRRCLARLVR